MPMARHPRVAMVELMNDTISTNILLAHNQQCNVRARARYDDTRHWARTRNRAHNLRSQLTTAAVTDPFGLTGLNIYSCFTSNGVVTCKRLQVTVLQACLSNAMLG